MVMPRVGVNLTAGIPLWVRGDVRGEGNCRSRMPGLPECRRLLAIPIEVDGHLGLRAVAFERVDVEIGDRPGLRAAGRLHTKVPPEAIEKLIRHHTSEGSHVGPCDPHPAA